MALSDDAADRLARAQAALIQLLARAAFAKMWRALGEDSALSPRDAIQAAQADFGGAFARALAGAFSELLQRSVGVAEVRAMPVGDIALSQRLHRHDAQTLAEVLQAIKAHAQGVHQARELALALYDGYSPAQGPKRPLEGRSRADLPRYLRELTNDPEARQSLARVIEQGQAQAARLKSAPLRAAYAEALGAWEAGAGREALKRRLEIAQREKNRFFANRIAQTELARAHQADVAAELMADESIDVVQVRINPAHPRTDICDFHARADLFGLGPGNYPKAKAPRPPFHPFCWCRLRSRPSLSAAGARPMPGAEAAYLRSMPVDEAARVMGSRQRLQRVLDGASVDSVINAGVDPLYRLARLGDPGAGHALVENAGMAVDAATFGSWARQVAGPMYLAKHEFVAVASLPKFVLSDTDVARLRPIGSTVYISDFQLRHSLRPSKAARNAALPIEVAADLPARLAAARWAFDKTHDGVIAFFDAGVPGRIGKAVVHFNHVRRGHKYNAVLTTGLVNPENESEREYRSLKKPKA